MNIVHMVQATLPMVTLFAPAAFVIILIPVCSFFKTTVLVKLEKLGVEITINGGQTKT